MYNKIKSSLKKYSLIIVLSIGFIIFLGHTYLNVNKIKTNFNLQYKDWEYKKKELEDKVNGNNMILNLIVNLNNHQILSEYKDISSIIGSSILNKSVSLKKVIEESDNPKLIFRFSESSCELCVDSVLVCLRKHSDRIGKKNIIILTSYDDIAYLVLFKKYEEIDFQIYNARNIDLPIEKLNVPYLFVIDKSLKTNCIFIPEKTIQKRTDLYFQTIVKRYFSK
jgi:hypothetical protein